MALAGVLALTAACGATKPPAQASNTVDTLALRGVRLIDGTGGPPVEDAVVVVSGGRIVAAGARAAVTLPQDVQVLDLPGRSVFPGLVSDHAHVGVVDGVESGAGLDSRENILRELVQFEAYGVTSVTSLGFNQSTFYELQPALHRGALPGADLFGADRGIGVPQGAPPVNLDPEQLHRVATPEEARAAVRETALHHPDLVKIWVDDFHGALGTKMPPEIYRAVIDEAHRSGLRVAAHVYYLDDAAKLVEAGVDVLAHGVRDREVDAAFAAAMRARGTWYVPTLGLDESFYLFAEHPELAEDPFVAPALSPPLLARFRDVRWRASVTEDRSKLATDKASLAMNQRNVKLLHDAGVRIGFGTDSGATPLRIPGFAEHRELRLLHEAGLTPLQVLHCATENAARLLGLHDRGTIAPGMLADLVVVDGEPDRRIEDADRIVAVFHRGRRATEPSALAHR